MVLPPKEGEECIVKECTTAQVWLIVDQDEFSQEVNAQSYSGTQLAPTFWIFSPETGIMAPSWRTLIPIV